MLIFQMNSDDNVSCENVLELTGRLDALMRYTDTRIFLSMGLTFIVLALSIWFVWYISKYWATHDWFKFLMMIFMPVITFYLSLFLLLTPVFQQGDDLSGRCETTESQNVFCISIDEVQNCEDVDEYQKSISEDYHIRYKSTYNMPSLFSIVPKSYGLGTIFLCVLIPFIVYFINRRKITD